MELRVLKYFLAVALEGSITRAANTLHVTQPTLSRQLKDLEDELGHKLFTRGSHNVSLTDEGLLLKKRAEEILEMVAKTEAEFASSHDNVCGEIYIGSGETKGVKSIAHIIREIQIQYPGIKFHLYSGNADDLSERLDKGLLDFGIMIQPADISKYDYINMPDKDVWGVVMRKDSPLASKKKIGQKDLLNKPILCSRQAINRMSSKNEFSDWFGNDLEKINVVATYNLIYNAALMVEAGVGYAIGLEKLVNTSEESDLCFRPLTPKIESGLNVVWKKQRKFSSVAEIFLSKMQDFFTVTK